MNPILDLLGKSKDLVAIQAADAVGLFAALERGKRSQRDLAESLCVDFDRLGALLGYLEGARLLEVGDDGWGWVAASERFLRASSPDSMLPLLRVERWASRAHLSAHGLVEALRGASRPTEIPDDLVECLAAAMAVGARSAASWVARTQELAACRRLADVGGGPGCYAVAAVRRHPELRAVVLDRPVMLPHAERQIGAAGVGARVSTQSWDLHRDALPAGVDAALVSHVMHLLEQSERRDLLQRIAAALRSGDLLLVHDFLLSDGESTAAARSASLDWLARGSVFSLTPCEHAAELSACGFRVVRSQPLPMSGTTLIVAQRA